MVTTRLVDVTLPAFAAERRDAASLLLSAGACCTAPAAVDRHLLPARRSTANPPHAAADRWVTQTIDIGQRR